MAINRQEKWTRFITPRNIQDRKEEIKSVLDSMSQIDFEAILSLFKPEVRRVLKELYYK